MIIADLSHVNPVSAPSIDGGSFSGTAIATASAGAFAQTSNRRRGTFSSAQIVVFADSDRGIALSSSSASAAIG